MKRTGVFICHCGRNISGTVSIPKVVDEVSSYPGVEHCEDYKYMCSEPGQRLIRDRIREKNLEAVVVACCSPSLHEETFRKVAESAGLNRFLLEIANIREQCSWVHTDVDLATSKAITIVKTMVEKTNLNQPIEPLKIPVTQRALVIGAGSSGIQAALDIANAGHEVVLVEKEPSIGGHMAQLSETFPTLDCSQCILTPKMVEVSQHERIQLHTCSQVEEISGYAGNFKVKIRTKPRFIDTQACTGCGDCWTYCPVRNIATIRPKPSVRDKLEPALLEKLEAILDRHNSSRDNIIAILQDISDEYNWIPKEALTYVAECLDLPLSYVYRIASFYTQFSLSPRGKHQIRVCLGTACFVRGAPRILEQLKRDLGIAPGETTEDGLFTLETVNCLGACALGPLVVVDSDYHGKVDTVSIGDIIDRYRESKS